MVFRLAGYVSENVVSDHLKENTGDVARRPVSTTVRLVRVVRYCAVQRQQVDTSVVVVGWLIREV